MKQCNNCKWDNLDGDELPCRECLGFSKYVRKRRLFWCWWIPKILIITLALILAGCSPGQHHGHIYIHDPNHVEAIFDRPMSMSVEQDGIKVEASSLKPGFFEEMIKFLLIRPR